MKTSPLSIPASLRLGPLLLALVGIWLGGSVDSLLAQSNYVTPYTFNTLSGSPGQTGSNDGTLTGALFTNPLGVAVDSSGNAYVADSGNYTIRKIDSSGVVSTLAGTAGLQGSTDGTGSAARFFAPTAIAVDAHENVYVIDNRYIVRMITPAGVVTTIEEYYSASGYALQGIAVDLSGNIYATTSNDLVVEFSPSSQLNQQGLPEYYNQTTVPGTGSLNNPNGIAVDASGNIYVADSANNAIRMITPAGVLTTLAGTGTAGSSDSVNNSVYPPQSGTPEFNDPYGVAVDSAGNVYVSDRANDTIRKLLPIQFQGQQQVQYAVITLAGVALTAGSTNGNGSAVRFRSPSGIAVDSNGVVYVADTGNSTIRASVAPTPVFITWAGTSGVAGSRNGTGTSAQFNSPDGIAVDGSGNAYVLDAGNYTVRKITPAGVVTTLAGSPGVLGTADGSGSSALFDELSGITVDSAGNVYVTDGFYSNNLMSNTRTLRVITPAGVVTTLNLEPNQNAATGYQFDPGYFLGIAAAAGGNLFVTDELYDIIDTFTPQTNPPVPFPYYPELGSLLAGTYYYNYNGVTNPPAYSDGTGIAATFNNPTGIAVDANNTVYVADTGNKTVRKIAPGGIVTTLAGSAGVAGSNDSIGTAAQFKGPYGIAVDTSFNLYVTDRGNDTVRKITSGGAVSTLAGLPTVSGSVDGAGTAARFNSPSGIAVDSNGTIYVVDTGNNTIRKSVIPTVPTVALGAATFISLASAQLNGTINANNSNTTVQFQYGQDINFLSTDTTTINATPGTVTGSGNTLVSTTLAPQTGLIYGTYYYRIVAINAAGTTYSSVLSFSPTNTPPTATLGSATFLNTTSVQVSGTFLGAGTTPNLTFNYGTDPFLVAPMSTPASPGIASATGGTLATATLSNLIQGTTYYYQLQGSTGTNIATSAIGSFRTDLLSGFQRQFPGAPSSAQGSLQVNLTPAANSNIGYTPGWRFVGEQLWRASGSVVPGLVVGNNYEIEFEPTGDYLQPPQQSISITASGTPTVESYEYYPTSGGAVGGLNINLEPSNLTSYGAQWRFLTQDNSAPWNNSGTPVTGLNPGYYLIQCSSVTLAGETPPPPVSIYVPSGATITVPLTYTATTTPIGAQPAALTFSQITGTTTPDQPYAYVGQIRSDVGSSTGFVVEPQVVATAGHVVFNDSNFTYNAGLQWLFQREAGTYEPVPQTPLGALVFDGYAAQRESENTPGVSSPASQNLDVAALYFYQVQPGNGGYSGFLASDNGTNEFLTSSALKTLVGYPVDGIATAQQGEMFATPPVNASFTQVPGTDTSTNSSTSGTVYQVYTTSGLSSVGGNSGGPLCIQYDSGNGSGPQYYPAAIYLGGSAQTVVRAIDSNVIALFTQAETNGDTGANHTGGGITQVNTVILADSLLISGVTVNFASGSPTGAGWGLSQTDATSSPLGNGVTLNSLTPGNYTLYATPVNGYVTPTPLSITLTGGVINPYLITYQVAVTPQTIPAFPAISAPATLSTTGPTTFTITPPVDNSGSGQAVVVTVKSGPATISGNTVTVTGAGTIVLAANQAASGNYGIATEVDSSSITVTDLLSGTTLVGDLEHSPWFGHYIYEGYPLVYQYYLGYEYVYPAGTGVYLYDYGSGHFWYTQGTAGYFPVVYDFSLQTYLYYYDKNTPHRHFYNYATGTVIME